MNSRIKIYTVTPGGILQVWIPEDFDNYIDIWEEDEEETTEE